MNGLAVLVGGFARGLHMDALNQLPQGVGRQLLNARILIGLLDEMLDALMLSFLCFKVFLCWRPV